MKFIFYCKKNGIDEKGLKLCKCFDIFGNESINAKEYIEAYNYILKAENVQLLFKLFDIFEKFCEDKSLLEDNDPFNKGKLILKDLTKDELEILIMRLMKINISQLIFHFH